MSLRLKLVVALVALSAAATIGLGTWSYQTTSSRLRHEIDASLYEAAHPLVERLAGETGEGAWNGVSPDDADGDGRTGDRFDRPRSYEQILFQIIDAEGATVYGPRTGGLPVGGAELALARSGDDDGSVLRTVELDAESFRLLTTAVPQGAVQVARSLDETDRLLSDLLARTLVAIALVSVAAGVAGWFIARRVTARLIRLTGVAEQVATTGLLDVEVPVAGKDETGRLGQAFESMLGALARSQEDQQRLVQDAGHELRTPLTSLRTNLSVLRRYDQLPPEMRTQVLDDVEGEARELTSLVNELVELATDRRSDEPFAELVLSDVIERAVERVERRHGCEISVTADESTVLGGPLALDRAVGNLLENAVKFAGRELPIEVSVVAGRVEVADRGPGIVSDDLAHVFDRFYRAVPARSRPGSGLGLAIVSDIVERHGGTVFADDRPGGGASVGFILPVVGP